MATNAPPEANQNPVKDGNVTQDNQPQDEKDEQRKLEKAEKLVSRADWSPTCWVSRVGG